MDPLSVLFGAVAIGIPLGVVLDQAAGWLAHRWAVRIRAHVRVR